MRGAPGARGLGCRLGGSLGLGSGSLGVRDRNRLPQNYLSSSATRTALVEFGKHWVATHANGHTPRIMKFTATPKSSKSVGYTSLNLTIF